MASQGVQLHVSPDLPTCMIRQAADIVHPSIFWPVMMGSRCMICIHIMKSIMRKTDGTIRTGITTAWAGTAGWKVRRMIRRLWACDADSWRMHLPRCYAAVDRLCFLQGMNFVIRSMEITTHTARIILFPGWTGTDWKNFRRFMILPVLWSISVQSIRFCEGIQSRQSAGYLP